MNVQYMKYLPEKNMAPGKTQVRGSKLKKKSHSTKKDTYGVKKAKNNSLPKKKLKERTLKQIEEVNKNFATIHNTLVKGEKQIVKSKCANTEKEAHTKIINKKPFSSDVDVSQEELTKTLENIANL